MVVLYRINFKIWNFAIFFQVRVCKCDETLYLVFGKLGSISKLQQQQQLQQKRHQTNCLMRSTVALHACTQ